MKHCTEADRNGSQELSLLDDQNQTEGVKTQTERVIDCYVNKIKQIDCLIVRCCYIGGR